MSQVEKNWLRGPHRYSTQGALWVGGGTTAVNPAFRCGVQQADKLRAVYELKRSSTNDTTFIKAPSNLPSWGHIAQMCMLFDLKGKSRPLATTKSDHTDAGKQLALLRKEELSAVVTLENPAGNSWRGFIPRTQLCSPAAAVLHYNSFSRAVAFTACRILKIHCTGFYDDFGIVAPSCLVSLALKAFAGLNDASFGVLKRRKSEASCFLEYLGLSASPSDDGGDAVASLALSETEIRKIVEFANEMSRQDSASAAALRKLAGKLRSAPTAIMGRFGRAATKPVYELIAKQGGTCPQSVKDCHRCWEFALPAIFPRLIWCLRNINPANPVRIYSDATGAGKLASVSFFSREEERQPVLLGA